ncbi:MAG: hypothetical protein WB973_17120 [Thermoanaerobaculia bacterium]
MSDRAGIRLLTIVVLYALALPVFVVKACLDLVRSWRKLEPVRQGVIVCPWCSHPNAAARMATCPCGATEPNTVFSCSFCGATFDAITCEGCGATIKVL